MKTRSTLARLKASLEASAGDIVFGMEDGTVSIFGLVFGVAATTDDKSTVLIAGATGAVAAAVEQVMVRLRAAGAGPDQIKSMTGLFQSGPAILKAAATALAAPAAPDTTQGPFARSLWMLVVDFLAAAIPIVPFALLPVRQGRVVSGTVTLILLVCLGVGRAWIGNRSVLRTVVETVSIGVAAALAGVAVGTAISHWFGR